jgi:hypothetical protein
LSESWYVLNARDAKWCGPGGSVARLVEDESLETGANLSRFERPTPTSFREEFLP